MPVKERNFRKIVQAEVYGGRELPIEKPAFLLLFFYYYFNLWLFSTFFLIFIFMQNKSESKIKWDQNKTKPALPLPACIAYIT